MKIAVLVDSGCGLSKEYVESQGIYYLPLQIVAGNETYQDGIDLSVDEVCDMLANKVDLKTSLPSIGVMSDLIDKIKKDGYDNLIAVTLSSGLSSTMNNLTMIAKDKEINIHCIETWSTCYLQGYIAQSAKKMVDRGMELSQILLEIKQMVKHSGTLIVPSDMEHLKRGGRLTPLAASMASLLKIKPILALDIKSNGKIDTVSKVRTMNKALTTMVNMIKDQEVITDDDLLVICATKGSDDLVKLVENQLKEYFPNNDLVIEQIAPVISVHTGLGCIGVQYVKKVSI